MSHIMFGMWGKSEQLSEYLVCVYVNELVERGYDEGMCCRMHIRGEASYVRARRDVSLRVTCKTLLTNVR